jgi:hypothetical protein
VFERRSEPLLPRRAFVARIGRSVVVAMGILLVSLSIGALGYHVLGRLPWVDAFLNASMILAGMGPVDRLETAGAKVFAAAYAIWSGVAFLTSVGVIVGPIVHRGLHRFHLDLEDEDRAS